MFVCMYILLSKKYVYIHSHSKKYLHILPSKKYIYIYSHPKSVYNGCAAHILFYTPIQKSICIYFHPKSIYITPIQKMCTMVVQRIYYFYLFL